jgi:hypothetical protein
MAKLIKRITSFFKALAHWKEADVNLRTSRLLACFGCDKLDVKKDVCRECGCFVRIKARSQNESCPLGYW